MELRWSLSSTAHSQSQPAEMELTLKPTVLCLVALMFCTQSPGQDLEQLSEYNVSTPVMADVPIAIDRRSHPFILPPLDQRSCECCWALATAASIEGLYGIRTGLSLRLSAQLLVDCDDTNNGCNKGSPRKAFEWIIKNGGLPKEEDYPFTAQQGECNGSKKKNNAVSISGYTAVGKTEADLMKAVAAQPVVAGLALEKDNAYTKYKGGIFEGPCGPYRHAVTVVGYGSDDKGVPYWIVKNSYGTSWGDKGYMYVRRGVQQPGGMCGIAAKASYPNIWLNVSDGHHSLF